MSYDSWRRLGLRTLCFARFLAQKILPLLDRLSTSQGRVGDHQTRRVLSLCNADRNERRRPHKTRILRGKLADLWDSVGARALAPPSDVGARQFERGAGCSLQRVGRSIASSFVCSFYAQSLLKWLNTRTL